MAKVRSCTVIASDAPGERGVRTEHSTRVAATKFARARAKKPGYRVQVHCWDAKGNPVGRAPQWINGPRPRLVGW